MGIQQTAFVLVLALWVGVLAGGSPALVAGGDPVPTFNGDRLFVVRSVLIRRGPTFITAYDIDRDGLPAPAETYRLAVPSRARQSTQEPVLSPDGKRLFVKFNLDDSLGVFSVSPTGHLDPVPGTPFGVGGSPIGLAVHPSAPYVYTTVFPSGFVALEIGADGSLTEIQRLPPRGERIAVEPGGIYVYFTDPDLFTGGVRALAVEPSGNLFELIGSPFPLPHRGFAVDVAVDRDSSRVYALELGRGLAVFELLPGGWLAPLRQALADPSARLLALTPDDRFAYVGARLEGLILGFDLGHDPPREVPGSPFPAHVRVASMVPAPSRPLLYHVSDTPGSIVTLAIAGDGSLSTVDDLLVGTGFRPNGAAYLTAHQPPVAIDVEPGRADNPVPVDSDAAVTVALLGSTTLDVTRVDGASLRFGPHGAAPLAGAPSFADVNGDGRLDRTVRFRSRDTGIWCDVRSAWLRGNTSDGRAIGGADRVAPECPPGG